MVASTSTSGAVDAAYAACLALARQHYENFPVASFLVPPAMRRHVAAVYAFARIADDIADEGHATPDVRLAQLTQWRERLHAAAAGAVVPDGPQSAVFVALADTIRTHRLPASLFDDLLDAFAQDTTRTRYADWPDLLEYCRRSANPVGRIVLRLAGVNDARADAASDAVCSALQLTNFWQDLQVDWQRGRLYVPLEIATRHGASVEAFDPSTLTPEWRQALTDCRARTRLLFDSGRGVTDAVRGRLRHELRLTWLGGMRILERLERAGASPVHQRPALGISDLGSLTWRWLTW